MSTRETNPILNYENGGGLTGDEVVISGISGLFPNSNNVVEFMDNLYNKVDMVTEDDVDFYHPELPKYSGKIPGSEIHEFDNQFFRIPHKQADDMDPMGRKLLEQAYCAMFDAGINPLLYKGKNIGVFIAAKYSETAKYMTFSDKTNSFATAGSSRSMLANRISFWLDAKGPSFSSESASGALCCLEMAYRSIMTGECEAAIVGGTECYIDAVLTTNVNNIGFLSADGKTRCFDKNGNGYVKSQGVATLFLQKAQDAKRIYAEICNIQTEYNLNQGEKFGFNRKPETIQKFLYSCHQKSNISPNEVEYVEANGAATPEADTNELIAIHQVYGREKPIMVGCVKSNMGGNETVSGIFSIIKLCLAYHKGEIAGNLHYDEPLDIPATQGMVKILTENTLFQRGYTTINHINYGGTINHVILKGHFKPKIPNRYKTNIPYLILVSGRHERALEKIFEILTSQPLDPEVIGMLQDIYQVETPGFTYRGYTILDHNDKETVSLDKSTELYQGDRRPLWLVYSGMGSQWAGMGAELMRIPVFAAAIEKCHKILEPKGLDIVRIITVKDNTIFDNVLNCFVGIAAVQIGLTDILKEMGIFPDNIIGHSLGEMGCGYFDGSFSAEQMILTAYARGMVSMKTKMIRGSMAAVGLGYQEILPLCPSEIDVACHNSNEFSTISGPADVMKQFVAELNQKGVFSKEVNCGNIAFHSRYIQDAGPGFLELLKNIIPSPLKRSKKWISTSFPQEKWNEPIAQFCSAEYHTNNLLGPVYFEEAAKLIPDNAVVVEIAPHGLMQAILKRSHPRCNHISLTRRGDGNPLQPLFKGLGKLYQEGHNLKVSALYPKIEYPVSTETSLLPHLVEWYHEINWTQRLYKIKKQVTCISPSRTLSISVREQEYKYMVGHVRRGNIIIPEAAILFYVWETFAMFKGINYKEMSVKFNDVQFYVDAIINADEIINLQISIFKGNNYFEVTKNNITIASGTVTPKFSKYDTEEVKFYNKDGNENKALPLCNITSDDIYKMMDLKGHLYRNEFKSIHSSSVEWNYAKIKMSGKWITFMDALIQLNILRANYDGISIPRIIRELTINTVDSNESQNIFDAKFNKDSGVTKCGGVEMSSIIFDYATLPETVPEILNVLSRNTFQNEINTQKENSSTKEKLDHYKLFSSKSKIIDDLKWIEFDQNTEKNIVKVSFAGPSLRDVQNIVGLVQGTTDFGRDFSGIDSSGNRVMGLVAGGALASTVEPEQDLLWPVPDHWSLEEAATVPLPYVHAFYCLTIKSCVRPGLSVFVVGGAGALGQAVISICLSLGCTVYTTVGDIRKKKFLMKLFPDLNEKNIGYSYDAHFFNMIIRNSNKRRCDVVINNCATGELRESAMNCVGAFGQFLDISDFDKKINKPFGMKYLEDDRTYTTVDMSSLFETENIDERKVLQKIISDGISNGTVKPISYVVYPSEEIGRALRLLSQSKHRGRVLIRFENSKPINVIPRPRYSSNCTYLVVCGKEIQIGVQLITHLVNNGAGKIVLNNTSRNVSGFLQAQLASWKHMGANITISSDNLNEKINCNSVYKTGKSLNGVFIITPKSNDTNDQDKELSNSVDLITPVVGNLDEITRNNCPNLRYFVIIARTSEHLNSTEEVCKRRAESGLPSLLVRTELLNDGDHLQDDIVTKTRPLTVKTVLQAMEKSLYENYTDVLVANENKDTSIILDKISKVLGIKNLDAVDDSLRVKDLLSNEIGFEDLKVVLNDNYNIELPMKDIKELTICRIKELNIYQQKLHTKFDSKLAAFYNFVDDDIVDATEIFVTMPTLRSKAIKKKENLEINSSNLMLIPGFDGHHHTFRALCKRLKIEATTLQLGPDVANMSIHEIALDLKQRIVKRFLLKPQFYLLGYSFGVNVALEVASILEKDGFVGVVYCLDSSPDALRAQLDAYLETSSETELQNDIIKHMNHLMTKQDSASLEEEIKKINDWDDKVATCVDKLKGIVKLSNEYKTDIIKGFYNRINLARSYNPEFKLASQIVLLKGIPHPKAKTLSVDYGLSKYAKNPVKIQNINSDVVYAPYDVQVSNIVYNMFLDPAIVEEFNILNFCESYIMN